MDFELESVERDLPIGVYNSIHSKAEDIFRGLEGERDFKFSKEGSLLL